jgi:ankyrin repeat protein
VGFLIENGANVDAVDSFHQTALMVAAAAGNLGIVTALLEAGAKVGVRDQAGATALTLAIKAGQAPCALALAANPEALRGVSPLMLAAKSGNTAIINFFTSQEIGLNDVDADGVSFGFAEDTTAHSRGGRSNRSN